MLGGGAIYYNRVHRRMILRQSTMGEKKILHHIGIHGIYYPSISEYESSERLLHATYMAVYIQNKHICKCVDLRFIAQVIQSGTER